MKIRRSTGPTLVRAGAPAPGGPAGGRPDRDAVRRPSGSAPAGAATGLQADPARPARRSLVIVTIAPEGRKLLRLEVRNSETPIERKPPWIRTRARTGWSTRR